MIYLFTDFGSQDIYVGQTKAMLLHHAPVQPIVDLFHDVNPFDAESAAHLLEALYRKLPTERGDVFVAVVDPGVGGTRHSVAVDVDGRWFVGPDNGLLSVVTQRSGACRCYEISWCPERLSRTFQGRDLFAPVAAKLASACLAPEYLSSKDGLDVLLDANDLHKVIHVDHYGNAVTGIRYSDRAGFTSVIVNGHELHQGGKFCDVPLGAAFWYENSLGLIEIAANGASAARLMGLCVGVPVALSVA